MKILLDTNIFISSEDYKIISGSLQILEKIFRKYPIKVYLHSVSVKDINEDNNEERKQIMLSKMNTYPSLENPPEAEKDKTFMQLVGTPSSTNDKIDNEILYSLYKNCEDFLITEDQKLIKKAYRAGLKDRIFNVALAIVYLESVYGKKYPQQPHLIMEQTYSLKLNDVFFDSFRKDYSEFDKWISKISSEDRPCWVYKENGDIKAILILKEETEGIELVDRIIPVKKILKICSLKVEKVGYKIGELLLKIAFQYCIKNNILEIYLTHFIKEDDQLIDLIMSLGFENIGKNKRGEYIYHKQIVVDKYKTNSSPIIEIDKKYYPSFVDSPEIKKFLIPILPRYHDILFPDWPGLKQYKLTHFMNMTEVSISGNTIRKLYLSNSKIKRLKEGDILLFYRSKEQLITTLCIVEKIISTSKSNEILRLGVNRTVYPLREIEGFKKPVLCILFMQNFYFKKPISLKDLKKNNIINYAPQSITEISPLKYDQIKSLGELDGRFTIN